MEIPEAVAGAPTTEAAEWLIRLQNDEMSVEDISQWQQWLGASADNRRAFERLEELWAKFERLPNKTAPALPSAHRWRPSTGLAAAAAIGALAIGAAVLMPHGWHEVFPNGADRFVAETATGEHRNLELPDGSRVTLGGKSIARVRFAEKERGIQLESGEAFFDVRKDARRPFVVRAGQATITAIGTSFNVRRTGDRINVSVIDGAVSVSAPGIASSASPIMAGHQLTVDSSLTKPPARASLSTSEIGWRSGRLEYIGEPLKYVVDDVNRYAARKIVIRDAAVGELRLTGTVFEADIDSWLHSVEDLLPVKVDWTDGGEVVLTSRER